MYESYIFSQKLDFLYNIVFLMFQKCYCLNVMSKVNSLYLYRSHRVVSQRIEYIAFWLLQ